MIVIDPNEPIRYVLESERDEDDASVFLLRPMTVKMQARVESLALSTQTGNAKSFNVEILRMGLLGWENVRDAAGEEIPFETVSQNGAPHRKQYGADAPSDATLNRIPYEARAELARAITGLGKTSEDEEKNF